MRKVYGLLSVIGLLAGLSVPAQAAIKVGLVLDRGGKDDKSFNASAYQGLLQCKSKFGVETKVVEAPDDTSYRGHRGVFGSNILTVRRPWRSSCR